MLFGCNPTSQIEVFCPDGDVAKLVYKLTGIYDRHIYSQLCLRTTLRPGGHHLVAMTMFRTGKTTSADGEVRPSIQDRGAGDDLNRHLQLTTV